MRIAVEAAPFGPVGPEDLPLRPERIDLSLVRFAARRRSGDRSGPVFAVAEPLASTAASLIPPSPSVLEVETSEAAVNEALAGAPSALALVSRMTVRGILPPRDLLLRLDAAAARRVLARTLPGSALALGDELGPWLDGLVDEGVLEVEGEFDTALGRRFAEFWVDAQLFVPEGSPAVLGEAALEPALAEALERANGGVEARRLRTEAELSDKPVQLDARRGAVFSRCLVAAAPLRGPLPPFSAPVHRWRGVAALEVELRDAAGRVRRAELTEQSGEIPTDAAELRARARLDPSGAAIVLSEPQWTSWAPARRGPLDPQQVAGLREVSVGFGWVDTAIVARAAVRLVGAAGALSAPLSGAEPEIVRTVVGDAARWEAEIWTGDGACHRLERGVAPLQSAVAIEQPEPLPAPLVVRLCDPLRRFSHLDVGLDAGPGFPRRSFRLSALGPEAVWTPPDGPFDYRFRTEGRFLDGRRTSSPPASARAGLLLVGDPEVELRAVEVHGDPDAAGGTWLVLEAEPAPDGVKTAVELFLRPGERAVAELPSVVGTPFVYRVFGERYDAGGAGRRIPSSQATARRWPPALTGRR